jgi:N-acyl-D-aspartate/D-glutamate deacylase
VFDVAITGGHVIDGSGSAAYRADLGIRDGRVVEVAIGGGLQEHSTRIVKADDLMIMPGVIDVHTHYDAQLHWDQTCSPSPLHGVTTVVSGNCGLTLAPVSRGDEEFLSALLARVEAIPLEAMQAGVEFRWSGFPELLNHMDRCGYGLNVALMVGHAAVRRSVMGEAASHTEADDVQIRTMCDLLEESLQAGGFGLSTATVMTQVDADGRPSPPSFANTQEMLSLAAACGRHEGTSLEFIPGSYLRGFSREDSELMADMSATANRPLNWNLVLVNREDPELHHRQLHATDTARTRGGRVVPLAMPQNGQLQQEFLNGYVFRRLPGWTELFDLDIPARTRALADPQTRVRMREALESESSGLAVTLRRAWGRFVVNETEEASIRHLVGRTIGSIAAERGVSDFDAILDVAVAAELRVGFVRHAYPQDDPWVRTARQEVITDDRVVLGASDAGAHLDMMVGGDYPTRALSELVRDQGIFTLEELVHRLTDVPARLYGLKDRGRIYPGAWGDLVVFDPERVGATPMHTVRDLPDGASRLVDEGIGIDRVMVAGRDVVRGGEFTGTLPGHVLRSGRDSETVAAR